MCWSFEVSLSLFTGLFTYLTAFIAYNRNYQNDRWIAMFIASFGTMQFLEAILWKNINSGNDINYYITKYAIPAVLSSQGAVALYGASIDNVVSDIMYIIYIICALLIFIINNKKYTTRSSKNNLVWDKNENELHGLMFVAYVILPFLLYMDDTNLKTIIITCIVLTYIYSVIIYNESWGSNWCFYANALSGITLAWPYL